MTGKYISDDGEITGHWALVGGSFTLKSIMPPQFIGV